MRGNQFDLNMPEFESFQSLFARNAPILDLLQNKAINAQIIRGTLVLKDGSAKLFALKGLLKAHGCNFNAATNTWRRPSATVAERYAVGFLEARSSEFRVYISQNRQADQESPHGAAPSEQRATAATPHLPPIPCT